MAIQNGLGRGQIFLKIKNVSISWEALLHFMNTKNICNRCEYFRPFIVQNKRVRSLSERARGLPHSGEEQHHLGHCCNLRLVIRFHFLHQTLNALLEITVLGCVDERVDDAVAEHQHREKVVVPTSKVDSLSVVADSN